MPDFVDDIRSATDWNSYYSAYTALFKEIIQSRWGLGAVTFANHLHHTAIPDASGSMLGTVRWAAYSQPSRETLSAFVTVFAQLLKREPHRMRSNRYLLLVPEGQPLERAIVATELGTQAKLVDYWCGSLAQSLRWPAGGAVLESINVLFQADLPLITEADGHELENAEQSSLTLSELRGRLLPQLADLPSIVPPRIRKAYMDSTLILAAYRNHLAPSVVSEIFGSDAGIAAYIAENRAKKSGWASDASAFCESVWNLSPPEATIHIVAPGDTLSRLAREYYQQPFESVWPLIKALNPDSSDPNFIRIGQRIAMPIIRE
jgi:hypothetical protein